MKREFLENEIEICQQYALENFSREVFVKNLIGALTEPPFAPSDFEKIVSRGTPKSNAALSKEIMKQNAKIYVAGHDGLVGSAIMRKLKSSGFKNFQEILFLLPDPCTFVQPRSDAAGARLTPLKRRGGFYSAARG